MQGPSIVIQTIESVHNCVEMMDQSRAEIGLLRSFLIHEAACRASLGAARSRFVPPFRADASNFSSSRQSRPRGAGRARKKKRHGILGDSMVAGEATLTLPRGGSSQGGMVADADADVDSAIRK